MQRNSFVDTSVHKGGIRGFSGCLEHNIICHQIQTAKKEQRNLRVVFLDLLVKSNVFGAFPHNFLWTAFSFFHVPKKIMELVKTYIRDIQFSIRTQNNTTAWQHLEKGIMAGSTIFPMAFIINRQISISGLERTHLAPSVQPQQPFSTFGWLQDQPHPKQIHLVTEPCAQMLGS